MVGAAVAQGIYHPLTKPLLRTRSGLEVATYAIVGGVVLIGQGDRLRFRAAPAPARQSP